MIQPLLKIFLLTILFIFSSELRAQHINISILEENITINEDSSFTDDVSVIVKEKKDYILYPIFYDTELEEVSNIKVYTKKGKKYKLEKYPVIKENEVEIDYISSKKIKTVIIPPETEAKITYTIKCKELMYFTGLPFFSYDDIDSMSYQVRVPDHFHFSHNIIYEDYLSYLQIDSSKTASMAIWNIELVPQRVEPNPLMFFGIYKNLKVPFMRAVVVPSAYRDKEKEYMNDWYLNKLKDCRGLDSTSIYKIDELTSGIDDPMEVMEVLYEYVKANFKYVAIEIGMGAFIPSHANEVFINKQGDCKDLSNFLSEALNYKGIPSYVALAATYDHISDCDFPSLGSANHVVCVAYINDQAIVLDPTDPIHKPNTPVQSIQERSILIIDSSGGSFYTINGFTPQQNEINYSIELEVSSDQLIMEGVFKTTYDGIAGNFLKRAFLDDDQKDINAFGTKYYEYVFDNQLVSNLSINNNENNIGVEGELAVSGKIFKDNNSRILFIDFLPKVIETEDRETLIAGTFIGNTISKKVNLQISMDEAFEGFDPIEYSFAEKGVSLNLSIFHSSEFVIECTYEFVLDYISIEEANLDITNEILKAFKKITSEPVILKNKS